jgi:3-hydroxyisobutyrate dehydrogenase
MRIGIAGLGRMGAAMAERLIGQGHAVTVWNRTPGRTEPLAVLGASVAPTPAALAAASEAIVTILTDEVAIAAVYDGPDGVLAAPLDGRLVIEMSTVGPPAQTALAARVRAAGGRMIDCPVGGTVGPAKEGKLFGFVGGEAEDVERARPILDQLCRRTEHVGPVGAGSSLKLAINLPLAVYWQTLGEALALCRGLGLDGARLASIFADTSGGPNVLKTRAELVAKALDGGRPTSPVDIDILRKDLGTMLAEAERLGVATPVTRAARAGYDEAAAAGLGELDGSNLAEFWRSRSGAGAG